MKYLLLVIWILLLAIDPVFSAPGEMGIIHKGEKAQYDGFVMDSEREEYFRKINEKYKLESEQNIYLNQSLKLKEVELKYYQDNYLETRKELDKEEAKAAWLLPIGVGIGVAATLGIGWLIILIVH
jgi:hypothetical protein